VVLGGFSIVIRSNFRTAFFFGSLVFLLVSVTEQLPAQTAASTLGLFESHGDIGTVLHGGSAQYDASQHSYTLTGSGENMWFASDAFQFAWKQVSGDVRLTADISFPEKGGNPHRKAVLMIRQSLDAGSAYADVALHGVGLTSLQFRDATGATTHEIESNLSAPQRLRIEKRGDFIYMFLASTAGEPLRPSGAAIKLPLQGSFYLGIGVCSHNKDVVEKAVFSHVDIATPVASGTPPILYSTLETVPIASTDRRVVYTTAGHFEAPNWTHDGAHFLFNSEGHILRLPVDGGTPTTIDTGAAVRCNNDHGISPDAQWLAISDSSQPDHQSSVYIVPVGGGQARRVTQKSPSYWHGWSPDGKTLAFTGQRNGDFDIYSIPVTGGEETRLTTAKGLDDGPEYSPDGQYIYFNSERTGHMQIWRMHADGSSQEQVTFDEFNDWFPHISPDGKSMVFISFEKDVTGHPPNKDVQLRVMTLSDKTVKVVARLFGGQGTINVPSWSPDSLKVAFVSYQLLPAEEAASK
jgi:TolB protein